jgi:protein-disulfide isomerase
MKNVPLLIGTILGTLLLVVGVSFLFSQSSQPKVIDSAMLVSNARHIKGPENAKVTLVEFSDFQCPACLATEPLVQQITSAFPNDVRLVYRQFPLVNVHKNAQISAQAAEAAATFGKFWEFHDLLFTNQKEWEELDKQAAVDKFAEYAAKLEIDKTEFLKRIESQEVKDKVTLDVSDGGKIGVDGTPTFYVNGQKTLAPQLFSTVESLIKQ